MLNTNHHYSHQEGEMELSKLACKPCKKDAVSLSEMEILSFKPFLDYEWELTDHKHLSREYLFNSYQQTIQFVNKIAKLAENEGHHPVIHIYISKIIVELWTHCIGGLSKNDFILAAKMDELY